LLRQATPGMRAVLLLLLALPAGHGSVVCRPHALHSPRARVCASAKRTRAGDEVVLPGTCEPCNVVLTHTNADFDSLAGSVALAKLWNAEYDDVPTVVVMPRGANPGLKRFLAYHKHLYPIRGFATIRPTDVRRIGVVDTQSRDRLGRAADWLPVASSVTVFDHHNAAAAAEAAAAIVASGVQAGQSAVDAESNNIMSSNANVESVVEAVGSATTLIIERLRARGVQLRDAEATLFALGIRTDTGCLTYEHTTVRDAKALVWLMEQGASQQAIAEFGAVRMSPLQRKMLTDALAGASVSQYNGLKFATVVVNTDEFMTGMSHVAEELLELTACDVALLGVMHRGGGGGKAHYLSIIGRVAPRAVTVDLNVVLNPYGGGGHPKAAAASVRLSEEGGLEGEDQNPATGERNESGDSAMAVSNEAADLLNAAVDLKEVEDAMALTRAQLLLATVTAAVQAQVPVEVLAESIMTRSVIVLHPDQTVDEAKSVLIENGLRGAPVVEAMTRKLVGLLKFSDVIKATQGGRGGQKIKGVVRTNVPTVSPDMPFVELEEFIMDRGIGRLPVLSEAGELVGIITRTDILRHHNLYSSLDKSPEPDSESDS